MGHLRATWTKLTKSYPFRNKKCVDKPERECTPSEGELCKSVNADLGNPSLVKDQAIGVNISDHSDVCGADS